MPVSDNELQLLQADLETWFTDTCDIFRVTGADDVYGGHTRGHGLTATYSDVPCMVESGAAQDQERLLVGAVVEVQIFTVSLPADTDIRVGDHLVVTATDETDESMHLHAHAVLAPETIEIERKCIAVETEPLTAVH
jgi:hypothetical protein